MLSERAPNKVAVWLRRLDFLPTWAAWAIGLGTGALTGAALAGGEPKFLGVLGFLGLLGTAAALARGGEPVAVLEIESSDVDQSVSTSENMGERDNARTYLGAESFVVWIEPGPGDVMRVHARSPVGEAESPFSLPAELGREIRAALPPRQIGEALFRALFTGKVGVLWARSLSLAKDRSLHLQLRLSPVGPAEQPLDSLPWELLYQPDTESFHALNRRTPISRTLTSSRRSNPLRHQSVLRILVVSSNPRELGPLDLSLERQGIVESLQEHPDIEIVFLKNALLNNLRMALLDDEFHILHFMGHGDFNVDTGETELLFEQVGGLSVDPVSGSTLATLLAGARTLRLVILNANMTTNLAMSLVKQGLPAAIGMKEISDKAAILFSSAVYRSLANGAPVDTAVSEGRLAIYRSLPETTEWATPVLIMQNDPIHLLPPRSKPWSAWKRLRHFLSRSRI